MAHPATVPLLVAAGLSESFAHFVVKGERSCSVPVALWLLDEHDVLVPQLADMSAKQITALRSVYEPAPPSLKRKRQKPQAEAVA